jgi:hypothetical protein
MLSNGDLMHVHIVYSGMEFTGTLTDTKTGASVTKQLEINITSIVGSNTAYVGFTGSTGSMTAVQNVTSWSYTAP